MQWCLLIYLQEKTWDLHKIVLGSSNELSGIYAESDKNYTDTQFQFQIQKQGGRKIAILLLLLFV